MPKHSENDMVLISDLLNRYTDAVNRRDWETIEDVFTDDGVWDVGGPDAGQFCFLFEGRSAIASGIRGLVEGLEFLVQKNFAPVITVSGDQATASVTVEEESRAPGAIEGGHIFGMYADQIRRDADGKWRFERRKFRFIYMETRQYPGIVLQNYRV